MLTLTRHNNVDAVLIRLLKKLKISISPDAVIAELEKHPDYPSLLAVSDVLSNFQIENSAFRLQADELPNVPVPFIAHTRVKDGDFVLVEKIDEAFFGEMTIPQNSMGKVKEGQEVLIKLKSYPFEEYGMLKGKISYIAEVPYKDSVFMSKVDFTIRKTSDMKRPIHLKQGMMADAEIITQDATILQRLSRNVIKMVNSK